MHWIWMVSQVQILKIVGAMPKKQTEASIYKVYYHELLGDASATEEFWPSRLRILSITTVRRGLSKTKSQPLPDPHHP
jgi:hypothetical protein